MGDLTYLALAYGVIWLGLFAYLFRLAAQAEGLRKEVRLLRRMLQADARGADPPQRPASPVPAALRKSELERRP